VLARGVDIAISLGVGTAALTIIANLIAALAAAVAVTTAGAVGFVGLIVPHALRLVMGNDQRLLLPACALTGGTLLVAADTLARTIAAPMQLPVGVITALIGVPVFLLLLPRGHDPRRIAP
jgi:iron complex transport system permease protein